MKQVTTYFICLVLVVGSVGLAKAQDDYMFSTQTDVDIFPLFCDPCDVVKSLRFQNARRFIDNLDSLSQIREVNNFLYFSQGTGDMDMTGLHNIERISGSWFYDGSTQIDTVAAWPMLTDLTDCEIRLTNDSRVKVMVGFEGIDSLKGLVLDATDLTEFDAFHDLVHLGRLRTFAKSLDSINISDQVTTLNQFWVADCDMLQYVSFLPSLDSVGRLQIWNTPSLNDAIKTTSVTKVHELELESQPGMPDLSWLSTLDYLKVVKIREMPDLTTIEDIEVATGLIEAVQITDNPNLSECNTDWLCHYLRDTSNVAEISGNGLGCSSREEILAQCVFTDTDDVALEDDLLVYPNPVSDRLHVAIDCPSCRYEIYDAAGRAVLHGVLSQTIITVKDLLPGTYQLMLRSTSESRRTSFVKL